MFSFHKGNLYQKCVELRLTCWTALTESFLKRHRGTVFILIAYWELKSSMCVCKLNWNRRKGFNIQIITHLPLCNHVQGWLSIYTQFSLSQGVWLVATTHPSSETVILSQRKELYNHRTTVIVCESYVSSRSLLILCYTALKVERQIIAADQNSFPKLLLKLLHIRFDARQIESLQAKTHTHTQLKTSSSPCDLMDCLLLELWLTCVSGSRVKSFRRVSLLILVSMSLAL